MNESQPGEVERLREADDPARMVSVVTDAFNPNNLRLIVDGYLWAKVYGVNPEMAKARADIIANALAAAPDQQEATPCTPSQP